MAAINSKIKYYFQPVVRIKHVFSYIRTGILRLT
jgi:hypothetical protein